jgi:hypothetical protein
VTNFGRFFQRQLRWVSLVSCSTDSVGVLEFLYMKSHDAFSRTWVWWWYTVCYISFTPSIRHKCCASHPKMRSLWTLLMHTHSSQFSQTFSETEEHTVIFHGCHE